jgi:hypothetical protein
MAGLFMPPKSAPKVKTPPVARDAEMAKANINNERRRGAGTYQQTIAGSGLKTALGQ